MTTKKEILENLKWRKVSCNIRELPEDGSLVDVRCVLLDENKNIFNIYYYTCVYWANYIETETDILKSFGRFSIHGNSAISYAIEKAKNIDAFDIDGFDCFGEEILIDLSELNQQNDDNLCYYEWRYIIEDDGNISKYGTVI